jgi:hypothetical protein
LAGKTAIKKTKLGQYIKTPSTGWKKKWSCVEPPPPVRLNTPVLRRLGFNSTLGQGKPGPSTKRFPAQRAGLILLGKPRIKNDQRFLYNESQIVQFGSYVKNFCLGDFTKEGIVSSEKRRNHVTFLGMDI